MKHIGKIKGNFWVVSGGGVVLALVLYVLFRVTLWHDRLPEVATGPATLIILGITLILVHEGIHGAAALLYVGRQGVRFGFTWLTLVCKVTVPLKRNHYIVYALAPSAVLGAVGAFASGIVVGPEPRFLSTLFLLLGGISSGAGDFWFVWQALKYPPSVYLIDNGVEMEVLERDSTSS